MKKNLIYSLLFISVFAGCNKKAVTPDYSANFEGTYTEQKIEKADGTNLAYSDIVATFVRVEKNTLSMVMRNNYKILNSNGVQISSGISTTNLTNIKAKSATEITVNEKIQIEKEVVTVTGSGLLTSDRFSLIISSQSYNLRK